MANVEIKDLVALSAPAGGDLLALSDVSTASDDTKKITLADLFGNIPVNTSISGTLDSTGAATLDTGANGSSFGGSLFLNESANANMTTGLTINQGAADDQAFALKSSDVATGLTTDAAVDAETDDFFVIRKTVGTTGGATLQSIMEDSANTVSMQIAAYGGTADTTKTTGARALMECVVAEHNGSNALVDITADGNVWCIRARVGGSDLTRILVDEDGDLYSVTAAQTFDDHDDLALIDAYDRTRAAGLRGEHTAWTRENERALIELGVLGGPVDEGGMTNVTQMQRLLTGAVRQVGGRVENVENRISALEDENRALRQKVTALLN